MIFSLASCKHLRMNLSKRIVLPLPTISFFSTLSSIIYPLFLMSFIVPLLSFENFLPVFSSPFTLLLRQFFSVLLTISFSCLCMGFSPFLFSLKNFIMMYCVILLIPFLSLWFYNAHAISLEPSMYLTVGGNDTRAERNELALKQILGFFRDVLGVNGKGSESGVGKALTEDYSS